MAPNRDSSPQDLHTRTLVRDLRRPILSQAYELGSLTCAALHITLDLARAVVLVTKPLKPKRIFLFSPPCKAMCGRNSAGKGVSMMQRADRTEQGKVCREES